MSLKIENGFYECKCGCDEFDYEEEGIVCQECREYYPWKQVSHIGIKVIVESNVGEKS